MLDRNGTCIYTLCLAPYLSIDHFRDYEKFISNKQWIPCEAQVPEIDKFLWTALKERMAVERLEMKSGEVIDKLEEFLGSWEEVCYQLLAKTFGAKVNATPFEMLTQKLPLEIVKKHTDSELALEALFLGQAGLLQTKEGRLDKYEDILISEYKFLKHKYGLDPMGSVAWKHARIRPSSAPSIRVVQFSRVWKEARSLHSLILDGDIQELVGRLKISLEGYWERHISLGRESKPRKKSVGQSLLDRIIINVVAPIRFAYGHKMAEQRYKDSALYLLESTGPEHNRIMRNWKELGVGVDTAMDSQALLQLKSRWCEKKKCLQCPIGIKILR